MFFDLFLPFPVAEQDPLPKKKKDKGKNKTAPTAAAEVVRKSCWEGLTGQEKDGIAKDIALAGHRKLYHLICRTRLTGSGLFRCWVYDRRRVVYFCHSVSILHRHAVPDA